MSLRNKRYKDEHNLLAQRITVCFPFQGTLFSWLDTTKSKNYFCKGHSWWCTETLRYWPALVKIKHAISHFECRMFILQFLASVNTKTNIWKTINDMKASVNVVWLRCCLLWIGFKWQHLKKSKEVSDRYLYIYFLFT